MHAYIHMYILNPTPPQSGDRGRVVDGRSWAPTQHQIAHHRQRRSPTPYSCVGVALRFNLQGSYLRPPMTSLQRARALTSRQAPPVTAGTRLDQGGIVRRSALQRLVRLSLTSDPLHPEHETFDNLYESFRKLGVPYFGVRIIRILLFRVLC